MGPARSASGANWVSDYETRSPNTVFSPWVLEFLKVYARVVQDPQKFTVPADAWQMIGKVNAEEQWIRAALVAWDYISDPGKGECKTHGNQHLADAVKKSHLEPWRAPISRMFWVTGGGGAQKLLGGRVVIDVSLIGIVAPSVAGALVVVAIA